MPFKNENFILLLEESRSTCSLKLETYKNQLGQDHAELKKTKERAKRTYEAFRNPKFFFVSFGFDETRIREFLININEASDENFAGFAQELNKMLKFLEDTTLKEAVKAVSTRNTTVINAEILAELSVCSTKITKRINSFIAAGLPLRRDPQFLSLEEDQLALKTTYRNQLKNNTIKGTESHTLHIKNLGNIIALSTERLQFYKLYERLTDFLKSQIIA